ncbi:MAG: hypothetical protein IJU77_02325 [Butyrivibrio sp.]|nr:hypothetical protein [Butyrivibrio sp.]
MKIIELTKDNISDVAVFSGVDIAENIGRTNYRGLMALEDNIFRGGLIWQYKNTDDGCESFIEWFLAANREISRALFSSYTEMIEKEDVKSSTITIPAIQSLEEKEILKDAGFYVRITESDKIIVELSELSEMPIMMERHISRRIKSIGDITVRQFKNGIERCVAAGKKGLCEDLKELPISAFEPDVSACYLDDEGEVAGLFLFHMLPSGMLTIELMICLEKDVGKALMGMMRLFVIKMEEKYPPDTKILLNRHNQASLLLSEKLLPRGFGIPEYQGKRTELKKGEADV